MTAGGRVYLTAAELAAVLTAIAQVLAGPELDGSFEEDEEERIIAAMNTAANKLARAAR